PYSDRLTAARPQARSEGWPGLRSAGSARASPRKSLPEHVLGVVLEQGPGRYRLVIKRESLLPIFLALALKQLVSCRDGGPTATFILCRLILGHANAGQHHADEYR